MLLLYAVFNEGRSYLLIFDFNPRFWPVSHNISLLPGSLTVIALSAERLSV